MDFSHYTTNPVKLAVALANTAEGPSSSLRTVGDLVDLVEPYEFLWEGVARAPRTADIKPARALSHSLRQVFAAADESAAAAALNELLETYHATPRISNHSGTPHLHFEPLDTSISSWLGAITAMGLASVLVECGLDRFGICDADGCESVYVDTSRNRSRRHCSNTCSTREAVSAYRKRKAD